MNDLERAREILYNWDEWHKAREGLPAEPGALRILRLLLSIAEAAKALEIYSDDFCNLYPSQESLEKLTNLLEGIEE